MFGVHPLHVESVAWVSERKDVLSTLFWMLTLWAYARYVTEGKRTSYIELPMRETADHASCDMQHGKKSGVQGPKSKVWYGCALVTFALGLMCKPMLVTLPFVLLLLDFWPLNRFPQKNPMKLVVEKAPFFLLSVAICVITIPTQKGAGAVRTMANFPLMIRLENVPVSYCRYLGKLFWPANLPFFYPYPVHWPPVAVLGATLLLLCLLICAWMTRRDHPYFLMGWCWFVGTLVPVIGLVQVGFQSIANRYTYVPSIGIFLALSWGVPALIRHWRHQFFVLFTLATTAILVCIPVTRIQIGYWKDSVALFQYASVVIKNNWGAHAQLGLYFSEEGRLDEAISEYRDVLRVKPDDTDAHYDLANVLYRKGLWDEAINEYREDLKLSPNDPEGHNNLGVILFRKGNRNEAIIQFKEALRLKPDFADVQKNLAAAMAVPKNAPSAANPALPASPEN
jgi:hypothetical protein